MTQFVIVFLGRVRPRRKSSFSCLYKGSESAYFLNMISATMDGDASEFLNMPLGDAAVIIVPSASGG